MHRQWLIRKKLSHALLGIFKTHAVQRTDDAPYQIRVLRNVCRHNKTPCPDLRHVQKDSATKTSSQVRARKKKSVQVSYHVYATIARDVNVVKRTCKGTELCMVLLARKKCTIRFRDNAGALLKKITTVFSVPHLAPKVLLSTAPNDVFSEKFFLVFLQQLKAKNLIVTHDIVLWQNLPCYKKWNQTDKTPSKHEAFLRTNPSLNKEV